LFTKYYAISNFLRMDIRNIYHELFKDDDENYDDYEILNLIRKPYIVWSQPDFFKYI